MFANVSTTGARGLIRRTGADPCRIGTMGPLPSEGVGGRIPLVSYFVTPYGRKYPVRRSVAACLRLMRTNGCRRTVSIVARGGPLPFVAKAVYTRTYVNGYAHGFCRSPMRVHRVGLRTTRGKCRTLVGGLATPTVAGRNGTTIVNKKPTNVTTTCFLHETKVTIAMFRGGSTLNNIIHRIVPRFEVPKASVSGSTTLLRGVNIRIHLGARMGSATTLGTRKFAAIVLTMKTSRPKMLELRRNRTGGTLRFLTSFGTGSKGLSVNGGIMIVNNNGATVSATETTGHAANIRRMCLMCEEAGHCVPTSRRRLMVTMRSNMRFVRLLSPIGLRGKGLVYRIVILNSVSTSKEENIIGAKRLGRVPTSAIVTTINRGIPATLCRTGKVGMGSEKHTLMGRRALRAGMRGICIINSKLNKPTAMMRNVHSNLGTTRTIVKRALMESFSTRASRTIMCREGNGLRSMHRSDARTGEYLGYTKVYRGYGRIYPGETGMTVGIPKLRGRRVVRMSCVYGRYNGYGDFYPCSDTPCLSGFALFVSRGSVTSDGGRKFAMLSGSTMRYGIHFYKRVLS